MNVPLFLEIKEEYTSHLIDTLNPFILEGLKSLYNNSRDIAKEGGDANEQILVIFQKLLKTVDNWTNVEIEKETMRIKHNSGTVDCLDDLVKAVVKSNIILLSYSNTISNIIAQSYYNNLTTNSLIHRCYIECAKDAYNNPFLFLHDVSPMDYKRNQMTIKQNIQSGIVRGIRKILPISLILKEFLANSMNIIDEPNIEQKNNYPITQLDKKIEQDALNIIKSEKNKTDKEKMQQLINLDKLITSMEPEKKQPNVNNENQFGRRPNQVEPNNGFQHQSEKGIPEMMLNTPYHLLRGGNKMNNSEIENAGLKKEDRKIINVNINNMPTPQNKSITSATSLSGYSNNKKYGDTGTETVDPDNLQYIEEYGVNSVNKKKKYK